ncbi:hypothetical protein VKT23_009133 [Stygiomarasmius scandens]|uniref:Cytochrome P450 n=1 Tax=Marasmiellus scandens TaxID=2682957 RepID=A0ABR1JIN5_9AGAR
MLNDPENLQKNARDYAGASILRITYGMTSEKKKAYYVKLADLAMQSFIEGSNHGSYMVDYFPSLKYIPSWVPGAGFKRQAAIWAQYVSDLNRHPWQYLKSSIANGTAIPSMATKGLDYVSSDIEKMEPVIQHICAVAYTAGTDTTVSLLLSLILVLVCHPELQKRAQAELDSVVGSDRLPDFKDRENLPYLDAIIKETQRMYPVAPLGLSHYSLEDDIYEGHFIPKGTTVVGNVWAVLHDERIYPNPMEFKPERFLKQEGKPTAPDSAIYAFGFGRRVCPGRFYVLDAVWLVLACVLATLDVTKVFDIDGKEIEIVVQHTPGTIR